MSTLSYSRNVRKEHELEFAMEIQSRVAKFSGLFSLLTFLLQTVKKTVYVNAFRIVKVLYFILYLYGIWCSAEVMQYQRG